MKFQDYLFFGVFLITLLYASLAKADIINYLQANLTEDYAMIIDEEPFYYNIFDIYADGEATLTFNNYNANLGSDNPDYDFNDPYLYLYTLESTSFKNINSFSTHYVLTAEDDDGNENSPEGLYFFLDNIIMTNHMVALVSSYDPYVTGTVDFTITSDKDLTIAQIPEPTAIGLLLLGGSSLLLINKKLKDRIIE
tara:strand:+ start:1478 stop:2062 length:585 start_codon:yes stop_codon:yes gene_type:complete